MLQEVVLDFLHAGPEAARRTKLLLKEVAPLPDRDLIERTALQIALARTSEEGREGLQSFFDKKPPTWTTQVKELIRENGPKLEC